MQVEMFLYGASIDALDSVKASYVVVGEYKLDANVLRVKVDVPDNKAKVLGFVSSPVGRKVSATMTLHAFRGEWFNEVKRATSSIGTIGRVFVVRKSGEECAVVVKEIDLGRVLGFQVADVIRRLADLSRTSVVLEHRISKIQERFGLSEFGAPFYGGQYANALKYFGLAFEEIATNGYTPKVDACVGVESTAEAVNRRYSEGENPSIDALSHVIAARTWYLNRPKMTDEDDRWLDADVRATIAQTANSEVLLQRTVLNRALWILKWHIEFLAKDSERKSMMAKMSNPIVQNFSIGDFIDVDATFVEYNISKTRRFSKEGEINYRYVFVLSCGLHAQWNTRVCILNLSHRNLIKGDVLRVRATVKDIVLDKKSGERFLVLTYAKVFRKGEEPALKAKQRKTRKVA